MVSFKSVYLENGMRKVLTRLLMVMATLLVLGNLFAWNHARGMLEFSQQTAKVIQPHNLSALEKIKIALLGVDIPKPRNRKYPNDLGMPFKTCRFPNGRNDTLEAWFVRGRASWPIVILFHGYCGSKSFMLPVARMFHGLGYSTFLVDFYGSGGSTGSSTSVGYFEANDVVASFTYVRKNWPRQPILLYGYSMGGAAVLRAIFTAHIRPDGVVLESVFGRMLDAARNRMRSLGFQPFLASELFVFWGSVQQGFNGFRHNPVDYAKDIRCPTLILHGQKDVRVNESEARTLYHHIKGRKKLVVFSKVGHGLKLNAAKGLWTKTIKGFMKTIWPSRAVGERGAAPAAGHRRNEDKGAGVSNPEKGNGQSKPIGNGGGDRHCWRHTG
jgi:hypothetical protein